MMRVRECAAVQGVKGLTDQEADHVVRIESGVADSGSCQLRVVVEDWDWREVVGGWERM